MLPQGTAQEDSDCRENRSYNIWDLTSIPLRSPVDCPEEGNLRRDILGAECPGDLFGLELLPDNLLSQRLAIDEGTGGTVAGIDTTGLVMDALDLVFFGLKMAPAQRLETVFRPAFLVETPPRRMLPA